MIVIALLIQGIVFGFFCGYVAGQKGRSTVTWFVLGFLFSFISLLALIALPKTEPIHERNLNSRAAVDSNSFASDSSQTAEKPNLFEGVRDIEKPTYQLFLTKRFGIEKNATLEKFTIGNDVFNDLQSALSEAENRYSRQLELMVLEAKLVEAEAQAKADEERIENDRLMAAYLDTQRESLVLEEQRHESRKRAIQKAVPWVVSGAVVTLIALGLMAWRYKTEQDSQRNELSRMKVIWTSSHQVVKDCSECPELVTMPSGSFEMGSNSNDDSKPVRFVKISGFLIGKTEVTQGEWKAVMGTNPSRFRCGDDCPVESVSWHDAKEFAIRLSNKTGKKYRLPSEAEWEYAARAGTDSNWSFGNDVNHLEKYAWYWSNSNTSYSKGTSPVARKLPNPAGLYDMHGNVWEWTEDCWNSDYSNASRNGEALSRGDCREKVVRGGSWYNAPSFLQSFSRLGKPQEVWDGDYGFRIARSLDP